MARIRRTATTVGDVSQTKEEIITPGEPTIVILTPVVSSNVHSIGYHDGKLYVKYHKDIKTEVVYVFEGVPETVYLIIKSSESVGKAIIATGIKGTKF